MKCELIDELFAAYLDNEVTPEERTRVDNHLSACDKCREELKVLGETQNSLRQVLKSTAEEIEPSPQAWNVVRERIATADSFWGRLSEFLNSPGLRMAIPVAVLVLLSAGLIWHAGIFSSPTMAPPAPIPPTTTTPPMTMPPPAPPTPAPSPTPAPGLPAAATPPPTTTPPVITTAPATSPPVVNVAPGPVTVQPPNVTVNPPQVTVQPPLPANVVVQPPPVAVQPPPSPPAQMIVPAPSTPMVPGYMFLFLLLPIGLGIALIIVLVWPKKKR